MLSELEAGTADLREEAEQYVRILDDNTSLADYTRYLRTMHGFHAPIEAVFSRDAALVAAGFDAARRCVKSAWMRDDLRALGALDDPAACEELPHATSLARMIGIAYVLERSTIDHRSLPPVLAMLRGTATRYLDGYGKDTNTLWRAFGDIVAHEITSPIDEASVVHAARETFSHLIRWLARFEQRRAQFAVAS